MWAAAPPGHVSGACKCDQRACCLDIVMLFTGFSNGVFFCGQQRSIAYLFPSSLFEKKARPVMKVRP